MALTKRCSQLRDKLVLGCLVLLSAGAVACGDEGFFPTTVDPGENFNFADVVFDEGFYYCTVEPMLVQQSCGSGNSSDPANGCHANVTSYRLTDYAPLVADSCNGNTPAVGPPPAAQRNFQASSARMRRDAEVAPLLTRPTAQTVHPRQIFPVDSMEADIIRQWANQFSSQ